ncbi:cysteine desulfurase-like protein [Chloroflexota bacterium]
MKNFEEEVMWARQQFPALNRMHSGNPLVYFDGPAGTQVPKAVIEAVVHCYNSHNANIHGQFITSRETDQLLHEARDAVGALLGANSSTNISFGANMTTLNFSLSKAIAKALNPGDQVLITQLDHEANRGPWLTLEKDGISIREIRVNHDGTLDHKDLENKMSTRTRLLAMGMASNLLGTVNDFNLARKLTSEVGAWLLLDAVHYVPHFSLDVQANKTDFLLCSAYKFYGPHIGILYCDDGTLDSLDADRLRTQDQRAPFRIETGTLNFPAIAGVTAAIHFLAGFGEGDNLRMRVISAMNRISAYEYSLARLLYDELSRIQEVTIYGPRFDTPLRAPTISFTVARKSPREVARCLGEAGICTWDGHFYAIRPVEILGLANTGGLVRIGISMYNTMNEVERLIDEVQHIAGDS